MTITRIHLLTVLLILVVLAALGTCLLRPTTRAVAL
jgi:hypothetical protein